MKVLAIFTVAVLLCGTTAQVPAKKKPLLFCVLPDQFRIASLECLWKHTNRHVQELIIQILTKRQWGVTQFANGLCNPYEIYNLKAYFKKPKQRKLLKEAIEQAEVCMAYIIKYFINRQQ
uniref:Putative secreted protein n=1 Tax=Amblyomma triste TaxID=251400 RepID=A0A023G4F4_AMBTT